MRILVIGSEGNIGRPLVEYLSAVGHQVTCADIRPGWRPDYITADINLPLDMADAIAAADVALLLSAVVSRVVCEQAAILAYATNLQGAAGIARMCAKAGTRLLFFSTSEVYGPTAGLMSEDLTPQPNNRYGLTKWLGEQIVQYECARGGLEAAIVRLFMVYGEDEDEGDHRSAVIRFAAHLAAGEPVTVHAGTMRSWLHIEDACRLLELACYLPDETCPVVNIGHPHVYTMEQVADMVRRELDAPRNLLQFVPQPEQMTPVKRPDLRRQTALLGYQPTVGLLEGVQRVCERYR